MLVERGYLHSYYRARQCHGVIRPEADTVLVDTEWYSKAAAAAVAAAVLVENTHVDSACATVVVAAYEQVAAESPSKNKQPV